MEGLVTTYQLSEIMFANNSAKKCSFAPKIALQAHELVILFSKVIDISKNLKHAVAIKEFLANTYWLEKKPTNFHWASFRDGLLFGQIKPSGLVFQRFTVSKDIVKYAW